MPSKSISVIAQLLYEEPPLLNFARLVADLQSALHLGNCPPGTLIWDCDDLVMLDMAGTRFLLSLATSPEVPCAVCLSVSVGPAAEASASSINVSDRVACERIVQRILRRSAADRILWHEAEGVVDGSVIDDLVSQVPAIENPGANLLPATIATALKAVTGPSAAIPEAEPVTDTRHPDEVRMEQIRAALWPIEPATAARTADRLAGRASTPLRLAAHAMDATLLVVALPIGAALVARSMLGLTDPRLSARAVALTGAVMGLFHSGLADPFLMAV